MRLNFTSNPGNGGNQHRYDSICDFDKKILHFLLQTDTIHQRIVRPQPYDKAYIYIYIYIYIHMQLQNP